MTKHSQRPCAPAARIAGASPSTAPPPSRRTPHARVNTTLLELDEAVSIVNTTVSALPDIPLGLHEFFVEASLADLSGSLITLNIAASDVSDEVSVAFSMAAPTFTAAAPATGTSAAALTSTVATPAPTADAPSANTTTLTTSAAPLANNGFLHSTAPWIAGSLYSVVPLAPLAAVPDNHEKWFAITCGQYVGLTPNSAISLNAVTGVAGGLSDRCTTQADTLQHFNGALAVNAVAVLT
ncbi:hypothetical protein C8R45DRAFT_1096636 [Mycena sanguinolenta]|nr:hypothetical protein C8R45DRAFT_1096636 [Mycena sanguinolenta]